MKEFYPKLPTHGRLSPKSQHSVVYKNMLRGCPVAIEGKRQLGG